MRNPTPAASSTSCPSTATITSPVFSPASAAGEPRTTLATAAPTGRSRPSESAMSLVTFCSVAPIHGRLTALPPDFAVAITLLTMLTGMAKPMPMLPPERE